MIPPNTILRSGRYLLLLFALGACTEGSNAQQEQDDREEARAAADALRRSEAQLKATVDQFREQVQNLE